MLGGVTMPRFKAICAPVLGWADDRRTDEQVFDRLTLQAWRAHLSDDRARRAADLITRIAPLSRGASVLDFGCGAGQIANSLASGGVRVTGIDRSSVAIVEARRAAHPLCTFVEADWRYHAITQPVDCALFWFTTLCAGKERDLEALRIARRSLKERGAMLLETRHWDRMHHRFEARTERVTAEFTLVETHSYDPLSGMQRTDEVYSFTDKVIERRYQTRRYTFPELRDMCLLAGFQAVDGLDETGSRLSNESERLVLRAQAGSSLP